MQGTPSDPTHRQPQAGLAPARLRRLRLAALIEGTTLVALLLIAVPLKHLAGLPGAVSLIGPVHGVAFIGYLALVLHAYAGGGWRAGEITRLVVAAFIPFGAWFSIRQLKRKQAKAYA